jgi:hypothetical protein
METKKKLALSGPYAVQTINVCETKHGISILKFAGETYGNNLFRPNTKYRLNDIEFSVPEDKTQYQFSDKVKSVQQQTEKVFLIGYKNAETGHTLSIEEYETEKNNLLSKKIIDPDDEDFTVWLTLADRQNYEAFIKSWEQVRETEIEWIDFKLEYFQITHSDYEEIVPLWQIGKPVDNPMCQYNPTPAKWFSEIANELGFQNVGDVDYSATKGFKYSFSSHGDLQYVKMNGAYLYGSNSNEWKFWSKTDTYENCIAALKTDKARIRAKISQQQRI